MTSLTESKQALRVKMRARRRALSGCAWEIWNLAVCGRLAGIEALAQARTLLGYLPMAGEPDLRGLMQSGSDTGVRWCVPAWQAETQTYGPVQYQPGQPVVRVNWAPQPARLTLVDYSEPEVVCVPGLAFDACGHRLGHGAGHYDRMLAAIDAARSAAGLTAALKLGVTVEELIVDQVPVDGSDVGMDGVITETRAIAVSGGV